MEAIAILNNHICLPAKMNDAVELFQMYKKFKPFLPYIGDPGFQVNISFHIHTYIYIEIYTKRYKCLSWCRLRSWRLSNYRSSVSKNSRYSYRRCRITFNTMVDNTVVARNPLAPMEIIYNRIHTKERCLIEHKFILCVNF